MRFAFLYSMPMGCVFRFINLSTEETKDVIFYKQHTVLFSLRKFYEFLYSHFKYYVDLV